MNNRNLPLLPLGVLALLVALTFWLSGFVQQSGTKGDGDKRHDPDLVIENFAARKLNQAGDIQYVVNARKMIHYADDDSSVLEQIKFRVTEPGKPVVTATAPRGELIRRDDGSDEVWMRGGVVVASEADSKHAELTFSTPTVTIFPDNNFMRAREGVVIENAAGRMTAQNFELNTETRRYIAERVAVTYKR